MTHHLQCLPCHCMRVLLHQSQSLWAAATAWSKSCIVIFHIKLVSMNSVSSASLLHFAVTKHDGGKDIYSKPSIKQRSKPVQLNIPPQLPPRNSPRNSMLCPALTPCSPDYMDITDNKQSSTDLKTCHHCKDTLEDN